MSKRKIVCMCENEFEIDYPDFIDLSKTPEAEEQMLSGNFISVRCPVCGKELKPEFPFHIVDEKRDIDYFFIPELDRGAFFLGKLKYSVATSKRIVIGFRELVEKLNIKKNRLDDRAVEILKFYLFHKAVSENEDNNPDIIFSKLENANLIFHITGLSDEKIAVTKISIDTYKKVELNLNEGEVEEVIEKIIIPPYVSMSKLEWEKSF